MVWKKNPKGYSLQIKQKNITQTDTRGGKNSMKKG